MADRMAELVARGVREKHPDRDGRPLPGTRGGEAFSNIMARMGAGEDAPLEHPMLEAVRNSDDPKWTVLFYAVDDPDGWTEPVENLSE